MLSAARAGLIPRWRGRSSACAFGRPRARPDPLSRKLRAAGRAPPSSVSREGARSTGRQPWSLSIYWRGEGLARGSSRTELHLATNVATLERAGVRVVCASYLGTFGNARYLVRRMRRRLPGARVALGFWTSDQEMIEQRDRGGSYRCVSRPASEEIIAMIGTTRRSTAAA